jgi:hypothetical protein
MGRQDDNKKGVVGGFRMIIKGESREIIKGESLGDLDEMKGERAG